MAWASSHITALLNGQTVQFRPFGHSMTPHVASGQLCVVTPTTAEHVDVNDIVLCRVGRQEYLHFVLEIRERDGVHEACIGNARGGVNGWTSDVFGKLRRS